MTFQCALGQNINLGGHSMPRRNLGGFVGMFPQKI